MTLTRTAILFCDYRLAAQLHNSPLSVFASCRAPALRSGRTGNASTRRRQQPRRMTLRAGKLRALVENNAADTAMLSLAYMPFITHALNVRSLKHSSAAWQHGGRGAATARAPACPSSAAIMALYLLADNGSSSLSVTMEQALCCGDPY